MPTAEAHPAMVRKERIVSEDKASVEKHHTPVDGADRAKGNVLTRESTRGHSPKIAPRSCLKIEHAAEALFWRVRAIIASNDIHLAIEIGALAAVAWMRHVGQRCRYVRQSVV